MTVEAKHPDYEDREDDWKIMRDCARGEKAVKEEAENYLPMPSGFKGHDDNGVSYYAAYQTRAQFPDILQPTLDGMVGLIHRVEAQIEMPESMEPLWERATKDGLPLEAFHRNITRELLLTARYGVLVDAPREGADVPFLAGYKAESIINWAAVDHDLYVLDETGWKITDDEFEWEEVTEYRVLRFGQGTGYTQQLTDDEGNPIETVAPSARGNKALTEIPFVVAGPRDLSLTPEAPPLLGVARASLAIYRLDADWRHQLYQSGQDTLIYTGVTDRSAIPKHVGAGVYVTLPFQAKAEYIGPSCKGIEAHERAMASERQNAVAAGARMFDTKKQSGVESGEALRLRQAAETATLTTVALSSAACLEKALRFAAMFMGLNPEDVTVKANLRFVEQTMEPKDAAELVKSWQAGAISYETLYENLQRGGIASEERDAEEEKDLIDQETPDQPVAVPGEGDVEGGDAPGDEDDVEAEPVPGVA